MTLLKSVCLTGLASVVLASILLADHYEDGDTYYITGQSGYPAKFTQVSYEENSFIALGGWYDVIAKADDYGWLISYEGDVENDQLGGEAEITSDFPPGGGSHTYNFEWYARAPFILYAYLTIYEMGWFDLAVVETEDWRNWEEFWLNRGGPNYNYSVELGDAAVWWWRS